MNEYIWDEIEISKNIHASFNADITENMMNDFRKMSGDENPLHVDEEYAKDLGFENKVVYGMLTAALYSKLVGMYLPGKYCLLQRCDSHFRNPVYIGDTLTVSGVIKKKVEMGNTIVVSAQVENQNGVVVSTAKIEARCLK